MGYPLFIVERLDNGLCFGKYVKFIVAARNEEGAKLYKKTPCTDSICLIVDVIKPSWVDGCVSVKIAEYLDHGPSLQLNTVYVEDEFPPRHVQEGQPFTVEEGILGFKIGYTPNEFVYFPTGIWEEYVKVSEQVTCL